jgi:hypothetical protein
MLNPVMAALAQARLRAAPLFARWCERENVIFCPALPSAIAHFVKAHAGLGMEQLWLALQDISKLHVSLGLADPTLGEPAAVAINAIAKISPPRAWPSDWKERFRTLPYDLQAFIADHEIRRDKALRRAQNEAAAARQKLAKHRQAPMEIEGKEVNEGCTHRADA